MKVKLTNTVASIGAMVTVTRANGSKLCKPFISGEGLSLDQSHVSIHGLSEGSTATVEVSYLDESKAVRRGNFSITQLQF